MEEITKVIIPIAGAGTRFLPLSKIVPKVVWPVIDKPMVEYIVREAKDSGIEEIIFVVPPQKSIVLDYFKPSRFLQALLKKRKRNHLLKELEEVRELTKNLSISQVVQKNPLGDGHAILQALPKIGKQPCAVLFSDDIVESKTPCLAQLLRIFKTSQRPVLALSRIPQREKLSAYGVVEVEKIAKRVFKIRKIVEKPEPDKAPSNLAIVGKYILTPEVFEYLKKAEINKKGEIILAEVLNKMLQDGKNIYGYEFEGKWLECGTKIEWLKTHLYLSLKSEKYGQELKKFIKENKLL
jgi:UTP--glucose-1-phosphate uridylyltransferase